MPDDRNLEGAAESLKAKMLRFMELRVTRDTTKAAAESAEKDYREFEAEVWDEIEESPIEGTLKLNLGEPFGVVSFSLRETYFGRVLDKDAALEHFEQRAIVDEMTEPTISKKRVNEMVRDSIDLGKPLPPGVDFYANRGVTVTKQKG